MNVLSDFQRRVAELPENKTKATTKKEATKKKESRSTKAKSTKVSGSSSKKQIITLKTLNDLKSISGTKLVQVLRNFDLETLAKALKGSNAVTKDSILSALGKRALKSFENLELDLRKITREEVAESRKMLIDHAIEIIN